jgi:hypothetical protein
MKKLTVNTFFWYANPYQDPFVRSGNMMDCNGWSSPIDMTYSLVIHRMPKESYSGFLLNTRTQEQIHLPAYGISSIITESNRFFTAS